MKKLIFFIFFVFINTAYSSQQIIDNGDTGLQARTKINSNDSELYSRQDTPVSNAVEYVYVKGNATTDNSLRTSVDPVTGFTKIEKRISGVWEETTQQVRTIDLNTQLAVSDYKAGRISYCDLYKCIIADTGYENVRVNLGREAHVIIYNNTGSTIFNGYPVSVDGTFTGVDPNGVITDTSNILSVLGFAGVATMDIPTGTSGVVTAFGLVNDVNTQALSQGFIYVSETGWYTQTRPLFPYERLIIGGVVKTGTTDGIIQVNYQYVPRRSASRTYTFSSSDASAGTSYRAGFYNWASTSITLTQASTSVVFGDANIAKAAHVGIVPNGPGTVDDGQVGLQVTGTLDSETGAQVASQTAVITDDITTLTANEMEECIEKFSGQITISLYTVSGTPTTYSLTFNYGYSKYEDFANIDGTVTSFSAVWEGGANDSSFDIELLHHKKTGWTYAASGFIPGDSSICQKSVDQAIAGNVATGKSGAYKRVNLNTFIDGSEKEGVVIRITTGLNNTIRNMDMSVSAYSEELF